MIYTTRDILFEKCITELSNDISTTQFIKAKDKFQSMKQLNKFIIPRIEVVVTQECTLRCVGCSHLIDMHDKHQHLPFGSLSTALHNFLDRVDACICIGITGGEPFLYPKLAEFITLCAEHPKAYFVDITTNATIIPAPEVITSLRRENVFVKISQYSNSIKLDELKAVFEEQGIMHKIVKQEWIDYGNFDKRNKSIPNLIKSFLSCPEASFCKTLYLNQFFHCPRAAFASHLGVLDFDYDYLNVDKLDFNTVQLENFYSKKNHMFCNYCDKMSGYF